MIEDNFNKELDVKLTDNHDQNNAFFEPTYFLNLCTYVP